MGNLAKEGDRLPLSPADSSTDATPGRGRRQLRNTLEAAGRPRIRLRPIDRLGLILDAAGKEFGEHGYDGVTLDTIAGAAGVTKPVLYRHFESKEALYLALLEKHREDMPGFVSRLPPDLPLRELINNILNTWFGYAEENAPSWRMLFRDSGGTEAIRKSRARVYEDARAVLAAFLVAHPAFELEPGEIEPTAEAVRGALSSLVLLGQEHPEVEREALVEVGTRVIVGLAAHPGATLPPHPGPREPRG
jgi:AcrR family transcriptional regulator